MWCSRSLETLMREAGDLWHSNRGEEAWAGRIQGPREGALRPDKGFPDAYCGQGRWVRPELQGPSEGVSATRLKLITATWDCWPRGWIFHHFIKTRHVHFV